MNPNGTAPPEILVEALRESLDRLAAGAPVEAAMAPYPELRPALRPLLETAQALGQLPMIPAPPHLATRVDAALAAVPFPAPVRPAPAGPVRGHLAPGGRTVRWAIAAMVAVAALGLVSLLGVAAAESTPGQVLYPLRQALESWGLVPPPSAPATPQRDGGGLPTIPPPADARPGAGVIPVRHQVSATMTPDEDRAAAGVPLPSGSPTVLPLARMPSPSATTVATAYGPMTPAAVEPADQEEQRPPSRTPPAPSASLSPAPTEAPTATVSPQSSSATPTKWPTATDEPADPNPTPTIAKARTRIPKPSPTGNLPTRPPRATRTPGGSGGG